MAESGTIIAYLLLIGLFLGFGYFQVLPFLPPPPPDPIVGSWENRTPAGFSSLIVYSNGTFHADSRFQDSFGNPHTLPPWEKRGGWTTDGYGIYNFTTEGGWVRVFGYSPSHDILYEIKSEKMYFRQSSINPETPDTGKGEH